MAKFKLGRLVATPAALELLEASGVSPLALLLRHAEGDWGEGLDAHDRRVNEEALEDGSRLLSSYLLPKGRKIWVITEAEDGNGRRYATTILRPEDY